MFTQELYANQEHTRSMLEKAEKQKQAWYEFMGGNKAKVGHEWDPWNRLGVTWSIWNDFKLKNPEATDSEIEEMIRDTKNWWKNFEKNH